MPPRTPVAQRFQLFDETIAELGSRLSRVRTPEQMFKALDWSMGHLEATYAATAPAVLATVACRAGCDSCCRVPVDVQAHEVFYAAEHIQIHFPEPAFTAVVADLAAHRERIALLAPGARDASRNACALLRDGSCSIYAGRPQPCRSHHASDADTCRAHLADPSVDISRVFIPALRARMFAVMMGVDEAMESAGYDERCYDFGSALHEALTNRFCLESWMRRQNAFPNSCLAYPE